MAEKARKQAQKKNGKSDSPVGKIFWRPVLISIGMLALAEEQLSELMQSLAKRGEKTQKSGRKYVRKLIKEGQDSFEDRKNSLRKSVDREQDWVPKVLHWLNMATREDIETLDKKVDALMRRVA